MEEVNQKIVIEGRLQIYWDRTKQYKQHRTFQNNENQFYEQIGGSKTNTVEHPDAIEATLFGNYIWGKNNTTKHQNGLAISKMN